MLRRLDRSGMPRLVLALLVGGMGGWTFATLDTPLPWMLGPMVFCLVASVTGLPVATPPAIRPPMTAVIGVLLGSSYSPEMVAALPAWILPSLGLVAFLSASAVLCTVYYRKVAKFDLKTAYFCGMPGGVVEMLTLSEHYGADTRSIALVHAARNLIIVFSLPFIVQLLSGVDLARGGVSVAQNGANIVSSIAWLAATATGGLVLGHLLRLPAKALLGPMLVSAVIHGVGLTDFKPPAEVVIVAQLVLGTTIGCRFAGSKALEIGRVLALSLGSTGILLGLTLLFAKGLSMITPFPTEGLILAYSPGGLAEMGLIAVILHIEVAFVTSHHIFRVLLVTTGAALVARYTGIFKSVPPRE